MIGFQAGDREIVQIGQLDDGGRSYLIYLVNRVEYRIFLQRGPLGGTWVQVDQEGVREVMQRWQAEGGKR